MPNIGAYGENIAIQWLKDRKFEILHNNYRYARFEVDIIAQKEQCIYFIEVKTRTNAMYGFPEEAVDKKKIDNMKAVAEEYQIQHEVTKKIMFAIISITIDKQNGHKNIYWIEDVY